PEFNMPTYTKDKYPNRPKGTVRFEVDYVEKKPVGIIQPKPGELAVFESKDFQVVLFKDFPWVIKHLDIKLDSEALNEALSFHYKPGRFFNDAQKKDSKVIDFLKRYDVENAAEKFKYQLYLITSNLPRSTLFEIMNKEF